MKTIHFVILTVSGIIPLVILGAYLISNPISDTYNAVQHVINQNTSLSSMSQESLPCHLHVSNQTKFSGYAGSLSCPVMDVYMSSKILNYTGFYDISDTINPSMVVGPDTYVGTLQEELDKSGDKRMTANLILEPGHNATITYNVTASFAKCVSGCPVGMIPPDHINYTNTGYFAHRENNGLSYSHNGLEIKYDPQFESLVDGKTYTLKTTIMASKDVSRGTYWVILAPGNCARGLLMLLTVSDCEK